MRYIILTLVAVLFLIQVGCQTSFATGKLNNVGLLLEDTINDQGWGTKGYKGLLKIKSKFNNEVFFKEGIDSEDMVIKAVKEFKKENVNLIFGHGRIYVEFFDTIQEEFPNIRFVSFNGEVENENVTSLHFNSYAMGFFGGMVAGRMTETDKVGVIGAYEWQPEIRGFKDGAAFQHDTADIDVQYVQSWGDTDRALQILDKMVQENVDVVYPTGDAYTVPVIEEVKKNGLYAVGYISEMSDLGENTILTSTIQHVDRLYVLTAEKYNEGTLETGNLYFDFENDVISLGEFSPAVPSDLKAELLESIERYIETGKLPNGKKVHD
jgi:transcriptional activator of comK gene